LVDGKGVQFVDTGNPKLSFAWHGPAALLRGFARDGPGVNGTRPEEELS